MVDGSWAGWGRWPRGCVLARVGGGGQGGDTGWPGVPLQLWRFAILGLGETRGENESRLSTIGCMLHDSFTAEASERSQLPAAVVTRECVNLVSGEWRAAHATPTAGTRQGLWRGRICPLDLKRTKLYCKCTLF